MKKKTWITEIYEINSLLLSICINLNNCYLCFFFVLVLLQDVLLLLFCSFVMSSMIGFTWPFAVFEITKFFSVTCPKSISCVWTSSASSHSLSPLSSSESPVLYPSASTKAKFCWSQKRNINFIHYLFISCIHLLGPSYNIDARISTNKQHSVVRWLGRWVCMLFPRV